MYIWKPHSTFLDTPKSLLKHLRQDWHKEKATPCHHVIPCLDPWLSGHQFHQIRSQIPSLACAKSMSRSDFSGKTQGFHLDQSTFSNRKTRGKIMKIHPIEIWGVPKISCESCHFGNCGLAYWSFNHVEICWDHTDEELRLYEFSMRELQWVGNWLLEPYSKYRR
jgi:hypothetical protein